MVMMCFWLTTEAQAIFDLTASQVRIDSLLPVFTWQKPLGPHYADSVYTVSIAYPEFINMSEADIRRYQEISGAPLPTLPTSKDCLMCRSCLWSIETAGIRNW